MNIQATFHTGRNGQKQYIKKATEISASIAAR